MICEPDSNLPQKIELEVLRKSDNSESHDATDNDTIEWREAQQRHNISYRQNEYNVLPKFSDQYDHLESVLSLKDNNYLNCRWREFLNKVPEKYIRIRLDKDYQNEKKISMVRRKTLNGHFYGVDNKLAPIAQLSDPRKINDKTQITSK